MKKKKNNKSNSRKEIDKSVLKNLGAFSKKRREALASVVDMYRRDVEAEKREMMDVYRKISDSSTLPKTPRIGALAPHSVVYPSMPEEYHPDPDHAVRITPYGFFNPYRKDII